MHTVCNFPLTVNMPFDATDLKTLKRCYVNKNVFIKRKLM
jgi:hypothetical protein